MSLADELSRSKIWRESLNLGVKKNHNLIRWFYGPGESNAESKSYKNFSLDQIGDVFWITHWADSKNSNVIQKKQQDTHIEWVKALQSVFDAQKIVYQFRPLSGSIELPVKLLGEIGEEKFQAFEEDVAYWVQALGVKHPGVFLDHAPLRRWLKKSCNGLSVLNTFAYTGSLSVAAALGGAAQVATVDLSKATTEWAKKNLELQSGITKELQFFSDDTFEILKRFKKQNRKFDMIILDPPSFSRTKSSVFSTKKDLKKLHLAAIECLSDVGFLVTSINSEGISQRFFQTEILEAAELAKREVRVLSEIHSEVTFVKSSTFEDHLKGYVLMLVKKNC